MFAARDQENLIHGHQIAGATKATNLGRQLPPKTPAATAPKTPFKVPLNDENNAGLFGGNSVLKTVGKGNENAQTVGKKPTLNADAFKTPTANRAPLGQKTTNAKARAAPTTSLAPKNELAQSRQKSASARKKGPRISHAEPVTVDLLAAKDLEEGFDIGITHPRPKDLDDFEGELPEIDLSVLEGGFLKSGVMRDIYNMPIVGGMSMAEMREKQDAEDRRVNEAITEVTCRRDVDLSMPLICQHEPECSWECKDEPARRERIKRESQKEIEAIQATWKIIDKLTYWREARQADEAKKPKASTTNLRLPKSTIIPPKSTTTKTSKPNSSVSGPSSALSRSAASNLSIQPSKPASAYTQAKPKSSLYPSTLSRKPSAPTTSSVHQAARYAGARAASNTTLGYAKGRATSAQRRGTVLPRSDKNVFAAPKPTQPSTEDIAGNEDVAKELSDEEVAFDAALLEDALQEFSLPLPEE